MRFLGYIFAFYVLFLSFQPGLAALEYGEASATDSCCKITCEPAASDDTGSTEKEKQSDEKTCNPFQFCKCCVVFSAHMVSKDFSQPMAVEKDHTESNEKIPPQICLDFWQPPKIDNDHTII